jgi:hypothetical protein
MIKLWDIRKGVDVYYCRSGKVLQVFVVASGEGIRQPFLNAQLFAGFTTAGFPLVSESLNKLLASAEILPSSSGHNQGHKGFYATFLRVLCG